MQCVACDYEGHGDDVFIFVFYSTFVCLVQKDYVSNLTFRPRKTARTQNARTPVCIQALTAGKVLAIPLLKMVEVSNQKR